jgi:SAM-dependent methyltransferase
VFALTIFTGAFLLFQVQPVIARYIVPWFGGSPAVWTCSMLFFQTLLLAGYAYAHESATRLAPRAQAALHVALLLAALAVLPIEPDLSWRPHTAADPTAHLLLLLGATIGLPFFVLASTSPLLQVWFGRLRTLDAPYRLYALSNLGSLLALLSYPLLVEPTFGRAAQARLWSVGFGFFALASGACAAWLWNTNPAATAESWNDPGAAIASAQHGGRAARKKALRAARKQLQPPPPMARFLWLALPAIASLLLLAVTSRITQDIGAAPLLWVLPLCLYLLSFVLVFQGEGFYRRRLFATALVPAMGLALWLLYLPGNAPLGVQVGGWLLVLFVCATACHGEVARRKPHPRYLTNYYLALAGGGALGGVCAALLAPLVFDQYLELHIGLWVCSGLVLLALGTDPRSRLHRVRPRWAWGLLGLAFAGLALGLHRNVTNFNVGVQARSRNFYGVLNVLQSGNSRVLGNGHTAHGVQFIAREKQGWATGYYAPTSGAGLVFRYYKDRPALDIGVVGLGIGTLAAYMHEGDHVRFYEINPAVEQMARTHFTYLSNTTARVEVVLGDARLVLEQEPPQQFDALFLDAFSSDSVPIHMLTLEAFEIFRRHIKPDGVIAVHISSLYFDLQPAVRAAAEELGFEVLHVASPPEGPAGVWPARWMLLTRNDEFVADEFVQAALRRQAPSQRRIPVLTDDHANLLALIKPRD